MPTLHRIIYVPGLSDRSARKVGQVFLMRLWQARFHVATEYYDVQWATGDFETKLHGLIALIDHWTAKGQTVSLVGSSAGASLALHAFIERRDTIGALVVIAGALGPVSDAQPHYLAENPALKASLGRNQHSLNQLNADDLKCILVVKPQADGVVALRNMDITGAKYLSLPTHKHLWTIAAALTVYSDKLMAIVRRAAD